jgi:hypothetical protein
MNYPTYCIDNFLEDPDQIVEHSKQYKYTRAEDGRWPGERANLSNTAVNNFLLKKIFKVIHPNMTDNFRSLAQSMFQRINNEHGKSGWIHTDPRDELTAIIYLSKHKGCGTSIYQPKTFESFCTTEDNIIKSNFYKSLNYSKKYEKHLEAHNNKFNETIYFESVYNRLIIFNSNDYHGVKNLKIGSEPRLTFITFIKWMSDDNLKSGYLESKKITTL